MTGGGDTDELEEIDDAIAGGLEEDDDTVEGDDVAPPVAEPDLDLNLSDRIPSAGASDTGGRAAGLDDDR